MAKERLDKIIASMGHWSRREVKQLVREGRVLVDGTIAGSAEEKYDAETAQILINGEALRYQRHTYLMMHKPAGRGRCPPESRPACSRQQRTGTVGQYWICCRRNTAAAACFRWDGWIRIRRACFF